METLYGEALAKQSWLPVYRRQKHALRVINFKDRSFRSKQLFDEMNILNIYEVNVFKIIMFMFQCKMLTSPSIFRELFKSKPANKYSTRSINTIIEPTCKTKLAQFSISYRAPRLWNKIIIPSSNLSKMENFYTLKKNVKLYLLQARQKRGG